MDVKVPGGRPVLDSVPGAAMAFLRQPDGCRAWKAWCAATPEASDRRWNKLATVAAAAAVRALQPTPRRRVDRSNEERWTLDPELGLFDATDLAVVLFAANVAVHSHRVTEADVEALRSVGLADEQIFDIAVAAAASGYFVDADEVASSLG